jgi:glycerate dehydrogenase
MKIKILDRKAIGFDTPIDILRELGDLSVYDTTSKDELSERCKDADVLVFNKVKIDAETIKNAKSLKLLCVFATGYDNIDIKAAKECGVAVCNVPGYSTESVTLYTLATVTALATKLYEYREYVSSGEYSKSDSANKLSPVYHEFTGKTWGIIGYGNIGKAVGRVAEALGAKIIFNKKTPTGLSAEVDIDTLCKTSDIITVHCPLNEETRGIINEKRLSLMKPDVILVNEARGAVLDESDVAKFVKAGKIGGFGCDVYSSEPFREDHPYYAIKDLNNVILTPHAAWASYEARERCVKTIYKNIKSFLSGEEFNRIV